MGRIFFNCYFQYFFKKNRPPAWIFTNRPKKITWRVFSLSASFQSCLVCFPDAQNSRKNIGPVIFKLLFLIFFPDHKFLWKPVHSNLPSLGPLQGCAKRCQRVLGITGDHSGMCYREAGWATYTYTYIYTYTHIHTHTDTYPYTHASTYTYTCSHTYSYTYTYNYTYTYTNAYAYIDAYPYPYPCPCLYPHICTLTHPPIFIPNFSLYIYPYTHTTYICVGMLDACVCVFCTLKPMHYL